MKSKLLTAITALTTVLLLTGCINHGYYGGLGWSSPGYYDPYYLGIYRGKYRPPNYRNHDAYNRHVQRNASTRHRQNVRPSQRRPRPAATAKNTKRSNPVWTQRAQQGGGRAITPQRGNRR